MSLIIVESPTKAKTFNAILKGKKYFVYATMGHIRDLPKSKIGIDYENNFEPKYEIIKTKETVVKELQKLVKKEKEVILATDPDREGESIAYHVAQILGHINEKWPEMKMNPKKPIKRIVFHEITEEALSHALEHPEDLRLQLVESQQARRILDRIVGYELSPLLWKKMGKFWLSAGRVQTVALRLVVEREKEITKFPVTEYYQLFGNFKGKEKITAKLTKKGKEKFEAKNTLQLFAGEYTYTSGTITKDNFESIEKDIFDDAYSAVSVKETESKRSPSSPYSTSLLQQDGFQKLGLSSKMTMRLAQGLYENGLITYHRTDSFHLSEGFLQQAKAYITKTFGKEYALESPRNFKTKSKMAQEAHEAIRPTKLSTTPENLAINSKITAAHKKLYTLIFERSVATQMKEALIKSLKITISGKKEYIFEADMQKVLFDGFLRLTNPDYASKNSTLSEIKTGDVLKLTKLDKQDSATKAPPRYNDASLIKTLEEKGIGRPSTYAPIISLIQEKNYVEKEQKYYMPSVLGTTLCDYLSAAFPDIFNLEFTANMEEGLDHIAMGDEKMVKLLSTFYSGFKTTLDAEKQTEGHINVQEEAGEPCDKCGAPMLIRYSRFGKFMACSKYPDCKNTKPFLQKVEGKSCPTCNDGDIVIRYTKTKRKFFGCSRYPDCDFRSWKLEG